MLTGAMLIFGTIGIFRRDMPIPSELIAFFRGAVGCVFLSAVSALRKGSAGKEKLAPKMTAKLIISGVVLGVNWILLFEAYNYTAVSAATLCYYMAPVFVLLLSVLILRERLTPVKTICMLLSLAGMVLVSGFAENGLPQKGELKGLLFGLGAAAFYAGLVLLNKSISGIDPFRKTMIQLGSAAAVMLPYLIAAGSFGKAEWSTHTVVMLIIMGVVHTGISYALYFGSMDALSTQTVALFSYIDPVTALVLSALLLNERMTVYGIIGALLILGSAAFCELFDRSGGKDSAEDTA